jgi:hypothetical protein
MLPLLGQRVAKTALWAHQRELKRIASYLARYHKSHPRLGRHLRFACSSALAGDRRPARGFSSGRPIAVTSRQAGFNDLHQDGRKCLYHDR